MGAVHPLDPVTAEEMTLACDVVRAGWGDHVNGSAAAPDLRFPIVALGEPSRQELRDWKPGDPVSRRVEVVAIDRLSGLVAECVVDPTTPAVVSWETLSDARPVLLFEESIMTIEAVKNDPAWHEALARRGLENEPEIQIDPWPAGNFDLPGEEGRRLFRCVAYVRDDNTDNGYAHPIENLVAVVDSTTYEVLEVIDTGVVAVPKASGRYGIDDVGPLRTDLRPLEIVQPEGPSFTVEGNEVRWQKWRLRFTFHAIEGLILHEVAYEDAGRVRPILHRASIAEMVVPYGAYGACHWWKNAFDVGEWGLGRMVNSLTLGCDCLGEIRYADAVLPDDNGGARVVENAICMHEEDYGILWKHVDLWSGGQEVRRSRRFVISSISTVGNYEYGFYWYFYLDGTIQLEVKLTGILQTGACEPDDDAPPNGVLLARGLWAPNHQHLFCARLDVCVDGPENGVEEIDVVGAEPGPDNARGNGIVARVTPLTSEANAQRMAEPNCSRRWRVSNPNVHNATGQPTAYALVPASPVTLLAAADASVARRAAFATKSLWVTPYDPRERRPAGNHPNQHPGGAGLPEWVGGDRSLVGREVVLWHTFGVSHVPRPEDWPVMPVEYAGFTLRPFGFFDRNPALDVPPTHAEHCAH